MRKNNYKSLPRYYLLLVIMLKKNYMRCMVLLAFENALDSKEYLNSFKAS